MCFCPAIEREIGSMSSALCCGLDLCHSFPQFLSLLRIDSLNCAERHPRPGRVKRKEGLVRRMCGLGSDLGPCLQDMGRRNQTLLRTRQVGTLARGVRGRHQKI